MKGWVFISTGGSDSITGTSALNNEFVDALGFKGIRNGLGDEDAKHNWHGIREGIRQLEHNHC